MLFDMGGFPSLPGAVPCALSNGAPLATHALPGPDASLAHATSLDGDADVYNNMKAPNNCNAPSLHVVCAKDGARVIFCVPYLPIHIMTSQPCGMSFSCIPSSRRRLGLSHVRRCGGLRRPAVQRQSLDRAGAPALVCHRATRC
jgi:hypothetical protein